MDADVSTSPRREVRSPGEEPLHSSIDDVIAVYKKDVDRSLLRANLRLTVTERLEKFEMMSRQFVEMHEAGRRHRGEA